MKIFVRKGQAALEFMMTYGWAILVVLAAIGALSYFGILNPAKFTPDTCLASSGFACPGKPIVTNDSVIFSIVNGLGYKVTMPSSGTIAYSSTLSGVAIHCNATPTFCPQGTIDINGAGCNPSMDVEDGAGATVIISGCDFSTLSVVKGDVRIPYRNPQSQLPEILIVSITGKSKTS